MESKYRVLYFTKAVTPTDKELAEINLIRGEGLSPMIRNSEYASADQLEAADFVAGFVPSFYGKYKVFKTKGGKSRAELEREAEEDAERLKAEHASRAEADRVAAENAAKAKAEEDKNPFGDEAEKLAKEAADKAVKERAEAEAAQHKADAEAKEAAEAEAAALAAKTKAHAEEKAKVAAEKTKPEGFKTK